LVLEVLVVLVPVEMLVRALMATIQFFPQLLLLLVAAAVVVTLEHRPLLLEVETMEALAEVLAAVREQPMQHRETGLQIKVLMVE
jgi:uncharacterized membrane protein